METPLQSPAPWIEGLARVVSVDGELARIVVERAYACGACSSQSVCGTVPSAAPPGAAGGWQVPRVSAAGQAPLLPGERLRVGVDRQALTRATLVAYALPLAALICGAVMARGAGDTWAVLAALASLLGGVVLARRLLRHWQDALAPVVLGRALPSAATAAGDACGCTSADTPADTAADGAVEPPAAAQHGAPAFIPIHIPRRP